MALSNLTVRFATAGVAVPLMLLLLFAGPAWGWLLFVMVAAIDNDQSYSFLSFATTAMIFPLLFVLFSLALGPLESLLNLVLFLFGLAVAVVAALAAPALLQLGGHDLRIRLELWEDDRLSAARDRRHQGQVPAFTSHHFHKKGPMVGRGSDLEPVDRLPRSGPDGLVLRAQQPDHRYRPVTPPAAAGALPLVRLQSRRAGPAPLRAHSRRR